MEMEVIVAISESADTMVNWALAILGGSTLTILSSSYNRPRSRKIRFAYLLFAPAWISLASSMYQGNMISRRLIAARINEKVVPQITAQMNSDYICQQYLLSFGLGCLVLWLMVYLFWWVFHNESKKVDA